MGIDLVACSHLSVSIWSITMHVPFTDETRTDNTTKINHLKIEYYYRQSTIHNGVRVRTNHMSFMWHRLPYILPLQFAVMQSKLHMIDGSTDRMAAIFVRSFISLEAIEIMINDQQIMKCRSSSLDAFVTNSLWSCFSNRITCFIASIWRLSQHTFRTIGDCQPQPGDYWCVCNWFSVCSVWLSWRHVNVEFGFTWVEISRPIWLMMRLHRICAKTYGSTYHLWFKSVKRLIAEVIRRVNLCELLLFDRKVMNRIPFIHEQNKNQIN